MTRKFLENLFLKQACKKPACLRTSIFAHNILSIKPDTVKWTLDIQDIAPGDMGVTFGSAKIGMAKKALNIADVRSAFKKVGCKSVAQTVDRHLLDDTGMAEGFVKNILSRTN